MDAFSYFYGYGIIEEQVRNKTANKSINLTARPPAKFPRYARLQVISNVILKIIKNIIICCQITQKLKRDGAKSF